jgi:hypothetical protein
MKMDRRLQAIESNPFFKEINREDNQVAIDEILTMTRTKTSDSNQLNDPRRLTDEVIPTNNVRRQAVTGPAFQDELQDLFDKEDSEKNSSEDFLSDLSSDCDSSSLGDFEGSKKLLDIFERRKQVEGEFKIHNFLEEMAEKQNTDQPKNEVIAAKTEDVDKNIDTIKLVDIYEKKQVEMAEGVRSELRKLAVQGSVKNKDILRSVFSKARKMNY